MTCHDEITIIPFLGEREVFRYTACDGRGVRVVVVGPVTEDTCEALEAFIGRRRNEMAREDDRIKKESPSDAHSRGASLLDWEETSKP